jgi:hypothetical protein
MYPAVRDPVGAAALTIGKLREVQATVEHEPVALNWYHGAVRGPKARGVRKQLSEAAVEIIPIDQARAAEFVAAALKKKEQLSSA